MFEIHAYVKILNALILVYVESEVEDATDDANDIIDVHDDSYDDIEEDEDSASREIEIDIDLDESKIETAEIEPSGTNLIKLFVATDSEWLIPR